MMTFRGRGKLNLAEISPTQPEGCAYHEADARS